MMRRPAVGLRTVRLLVACLRRQVSSSTLPIVYTTPRHRSHLPPWIAAVGALITLGSTVQHAPNAQCKETSLPATNPALCRAVLLNDEDSVRRLLENSHCDSRHPLGWSPLHVAAVNANAKMLKLLLDAGADVNAQDQYSLQTAVGRGNTSNLIEVVRIRAQEFSRRIHPQNNTKGFTALHYAVLMDNPEIVKLLLDAGANPLQKNDDGHTARDYIDLGATPNADKIAKLLEASETVYALKKEEEEKELRRKFPLEARIKERIVGQQAAIRTVAAAIRRKENGFQDEERPLVFLFLGSSGIGKTELAKQIAAYMHKDTPEAFIRIDMSEYQTKHEVAKFIGSPPGYVGHEEGGQLSERLRAYPNAVVLLDEVEKAHADVLTIMLQLFDEGRLTDGKGQTIDCKDAIFVMTSNLAQDEIAEYGLMLRQSAAEPNDEIKVSARFRDNVVRPILKSHFQRNEFLGRINEIVYFLPFSPDELKELVRFELNRWKEKTQRRHGVTLQWTDDVLRVISEGYDVHYGARSLKFELDRKVINQIASMWEQGTVSRNSVVTVYVENDEIKLKSEKGPEDGGLLSRLRSR